MISTSVVSAVERSALERPVVWSSLPLRAIVGFGFMAHGYAKLTRGPGSFAAVLHGLGLPLPDVMSWATIFVELIGGAAVLAGAFLAVVSVPMILTMLVAAVTVHLRYGFSSIKLLAVTDAGLQFGPPGYETPLLYIACLIVLVWTGGGPFSIDGLMARRAGQARQPRDRSRQHSAKVR